MRANPAIVCVFTLFAAAKLSSSSPIAENDGHLLLLTARMDGLQSKVEQLANQLDQEKLLRGNMQSRNAELEKIIHELATENRKQTERFESNIDLLIAHNAKQDEEISQLKNKIKEDLIADISQPKTLLNDEDRNMNINDVGDILSDESSPRLPPSSCRQLSTIGHYLDGIYLVANSDTNKIETVYCDFGSSTLSETLYGSVDVKTESVHFYVQRSVDFSLANTVLPFDVVRLNVGGAMNPATGVFTAPVNGIYHFESFGLKDPIDPLPMYIALQLNGVEISSSWAEDETSAIYKGLSGISASLRLKTGDQVRLFKGDGTLADNSALHYTHFSGWLAEEDLVFN